MRHVTGFPLHLRAGICAVVALAAAGCTSMPELNEVKLLPEMRSFMPSNSNTYLNSTVARTIKPVGPEDLVDGQGTCASAAPAPAAEAPAGAEAPATQPQATRPVVLEMTECEVARALGPPTRVESGSTEGGARSLVLTYTAGERAGIYRFASGRLVSIERSPEAVVPVPEKKKPSKKAAPAKKPTRPSA
jgi:hypothetical protein